MANIAVVGAGLAGLTASLRLAEAGHTVRIFERYPRPGGLARSLTIGGEEIEAFYHHLFTSDTSCIRLAEELGLGDEIEWLPSCMGLWTDGRLWDFGTPQSLLRFRPLRMVDKIRFALSTLLLQRTADPTEFEQVSAASWIRKHQGERVWRSVWGPLLYQKFADDAEKVAMVWLWGKLRLRGTSRSKSGMGEQLGYMRGSFARLVRAYEDRLESLGVTFHLSDAVEGIERSSDGLRLKTRKGSAAASTVLVAAPVPDYIQIAGGILEEQESQALKRLRATAAICTVLELERSLTRYYWLNIADDEMPFGGLIEHTNYIPRERYGGRHILYISNYLFPDHELYSAPKSKILGRYEPALKRINPDFDSSWILASHHFRADYAQPVVTTGYKEQMPSFSSSVPGLYLCSMANIYPEDRGMNYAIAYGEKVANVILADLNA
jgi:protoporphyrinogen oxidase